MKKFYFFIIIVGAVSFTNCNKNNNPENFLRGKIDGQDFQCNAGISANKPEPIPGSGPDPVLRITGEWPSYSLKLMLIGEGTLQTGTYTFTSGRQRSATLQHNVATTYYAGIDGLFLAGQLIGSGSITIARITGTHVAGAFELTLIETSSGNSKTVTNGEFSVIRN